MKLHHALVIGGGIGGLASVIALLRDGVKVELIGMGPEWKVYGAGLTMTGPTLRAFKKLGLYDQIAAKGFFPSGGYMFFYDGTLLSKTWPNRLKRDCHHRAASCGPNCI